MKNPNEIIANFPFLAEYYDLYSGNFVVLADECDEIIHCTFIVVENDSENNYKVCLDSDGEDDYIVLCNWEVV